jgi:hypothetical protein
MYPNTAFQGRYIIYTGAEGDVNTEKKKGYALHLEAGQALTPQPVEPHSTNRVFQFIQPEVTRAIEENLNGPFDSIRELKNDRPVQHPQPIHRDIDPAMIAPWFRDIDVRHAVKKLDLATIVRFASDIARMRIVGQSSEAILDRRVSTFLRAASSWERNRPTDNDFREVMDSFVPRSSGHIGSIDDLHIRPYETSRTHPEVTWQGRDKTIKQTRKAARPKGP